MCVLGAPDPDQGDSGQAGDGADALVGVHGSQEESSIVHDPPGHRPLTALGTLASDQDPHLLEPCQHGHLQEPHPRNTRHVRTARIL